jgi:hypothetical protein
MSRKRWRFSKDSYKFDTVQNKRLSGMSIEKLDLENGVCGVHLSLLPTPDS